MLNGIVIRQVYQTITSPGNSAIAGLAIVANAQLAELRLSSNLTRTKCIDEAIISTLAADFSGSVEQNMNNMAAATNN